jgi:hypothetical protein
MARSTLIVTLALPFLLAACSVGGVSPLDDAAATERVSIGFGTASSASLARASIAVDGGDTLVLSGTNGTLELTTVAFIVDELELDCDDDSDRACAEFEEGPFFVDLPLGAGRVDVTSRAIPAGSYDELEFEIEDLDLDDDDSDSERARAEALLEDIRVVYPDFPADASMVVEGLFTPLDGDARPFVVFIEADVEVELDLEPPLVVGADGSADRELLVDVRPDMWFVRADGSVRDLSVYVGSLLELDVEIEDGFVDVDFD